MLIAALGSAGIGLVWGWLLGMLGGRVRRPVLTALVLTGATLLLAVAIIWLVDGRSLAVFVIAAGLALSIHFAWRRELSRRFGSPRI